MKVIKASTVDRGLQAILTELSKQGNYVETNSRNGPVRRFKEPATIMWTRPQYRVSFDAARDANPFFHLFESLWMLSGENDVKRASYFASGMGQFSDDGETFHGAYGHRWVRHFGIDQLRDYVIPSLRKNKEDRRVVLQMWDGDADPRQGLNPTSKDVPCNLTATFDAGRQDGRLHMNVFNRSNDIVLGAAGANIVHFSILHEYVASAIGVGVGTYEQISTNSHLYTELNEVSKRTLAAHEENPMRDMPYVGMLSPLRNPKAQNESTPELWQESFDSDIKWLMVNYENVGNLEFKTEFFTKVVKPLIHAYNLYKNHDCIEHAMVVLLDSSAPINLESPWYRWYDWNVAAFQWLQRRCDQRNALIKAASVNNAEDWESMAKKVWKKAERVDNTMVVYGGARPLKASWNSSGMHLLYRGLHADNLLDMDRIDLQRK